MNTFRTVLISAAVIITFIMPFAYQAGAIAPGPKVSEVSASGKGNKHNLSAKARVFNSTSYTAANPNLYKALDDPIGNPKGQQICIFCHTPHSANPEGAAPLWNRKFSAETFSRYSSPKAWLAIRHSSSASTAAQYTAGWQPDGASKLCLSCHDGVSSLGDVLNGGPITMNAGDVISGIASFNPSTNKMKTGHHPVSFVYNSTVKDAINSYKSTSDWKYPIDPGVSDFVKLKNGKMQCTTCHDAHQNQSHDDLCYLSTDETQVVTCSSTDNRKVAPFWVYNSGNDPMQDRDKVCEGCHAVGGAPWIAPAQPWH